VSGTARIGVFGALFNPPHVGHLVLCQEAAHQLGLQRVVLVPTGLPGHRDPPAESAELRLHLAQAAVRGDARFTVSRLELDRPGPSYMVDTLRALDNRYPGAQLVLLIGEDQLARLGTWHEAPSLPKLARVAVARRGDLQLAGAERAAVDWIEMPRIDVSSSDIRRRVAEGRPIRYLVPEAVRELIEAEGLYRQGERPPVGRVVS
jgi:nicotinate-nucleotide adenylyltransferase